MATFREDILAGVVNPLRYLPDTTFDIRTYEARLVKRRWQSVGGNPPAVDVGTYTDETTVLVPRPKVREQSNGLFLVDKITPRNSAGGYTAEELSPADEEGVEFFWELEGPFAGGVTTMKFRVVSIDASKPFTYSVLLESLERRGPT